MQFAQSPSLSIGAGITGVFVLLVNRLCVDLDKVTDVQSRADIISVVACSAVLLNVLSESDIEAKIDSLSLSWAMPYHRPCWQETKS